MSQSTQSRSGEYRKLWSHGAAPSVEQLLQLCEAMPTPKLTELLLLDQSMRWNAKQKFTAEQYFEFFPDLVNHPEYAMDVVYSEFLLRERLGLHPDINEYITRFPQYADELQSQEAFHRAMDFNPLVGDSAVRGLADSSEADFDFTTLAVPEVPGYEILHELGRGGIGIVYKARHIQLNRLVALKMLLAGNFASASLLRRFLVEAEATARLQHPNIVQIYEVGQCEGRPFLALEFVNSGTLSDWTGGRLQAPREAASIILSLAKAVHFAHEQGVVHRDLKPSNVLMQRLNSPIASETDYGNSRRKAVIEGSSARNITQSKSSFEQDFQLKIVDFGLAKVMAGGSDAEKIAATLSGDVLGTAAYMSPEQARGDSAKLTASTDVYSLGAMLYELLTGRPPFVGVQPMEVLVQVINDEPVRPSHLARRLPSDIQTICLKCLEKNPARRYDSADALADDLGRFLEDQPIVARHTSSLERGWRWCRRHPAKTSIASSIGAFLILVAVFSSLYSIQLGYQLKLTSQAKGKEQESKVNALSQLWESKLAQADAIRMSNQIGQRYDALKAIDAARALSASIRFRPEQIDQMRNATIACLAKPDMRVDDHWEGHVGPPVSVLAFDGFQSMYAYMKSNTMCVCRTTTGEEIARISVTDPKSSALLSDDGKRLAILNDHCRVYSLEDEEVNLIYETPSKGVWGFAPDGSKILGTIRDGQLCLVDLREAIVTKKLGTFIANNEIVISPDARRAAISLGDSINVIDLESGQTNWRMDNLVHGSQKHFAWHPNSKYLAIGPGLSDGIELWDIENCVRLKTHAFNPGELQICFSSTGERLLCYDVWGQRVSVWNVNSNEIEFSRSGLQVLKSFADESGGFRLLLWQKDNQLVSMRIDSSRIYCTLPQVRPQGMGATMGDLNYSPDGRLLAIATPFGELQIFDTRNHNELGRLVCGNCMVHFDRDGSLLTSNKLGLVRWSFTPFGDKHGGFQMGPPVHMAGTVANAPFDISQDGNRIAIPTGTEVEMHAVDCPQQFQPLGPPADVRRLSFSPNGKRIVTGEWASGKACVWDVASGEHLHTFEEHPFCLVEYSPDGKWIATNSNRVRVWNAETWELVSELPADGNSISGVNVAFSPDGRLIAVSDSISRINFFDPSDGRKIFALTDPNDHLVFRLAFNPDGSQLAVFSTSNVVHLWDLAAMNEELKSRDLAFRNYEFATKPFDSEDSRITALQIVADQRFVEIEAAHQSELLRQAVEKFDLVSARAAIARIIKIQPQEALTCNNVAWLLATGPQPLRDASTAVELAQRAIADESLTQENRAMFLNTLGVALLRDGRFQEAIEVLEKSLSTQYDESKPFDLYFLSICNSRTGGHAKASRYFEEAESKADLLRSRMTPQWRNEIAQFAEEAKSLLGNPLEE